MPCLLAWLAFSIYTLCDSTQLLLLDIATGSLSPPRGFPGNCISSLRSCPSDFWLNEATRRLESREKEIWPFHLLALSLRGSVLAWACSSSWLVVLPIAAAMIMALLYLCPCSFLGPFKPRGGNSAPLMLT